jgi:hypothetical protein
MKHIDLRMPAVLCLFTAGVAAAEVEIHPKQFGGTLDFGQAVSNSRNSGVKDNQPLNRVGVYLTSSGSYDKKFDVKLSIGGLFWFALPELNPDQTRILFGPGVGQAQGIYKFGDPEQPGHKYNPDAKNLGEYLFRSGAYPGYVWTGGWSYIDAAAYLAQGFRFALPTLGGRLTHELTLYMERDIVPAHDLSPAYLLTAKPAEFFELGAGIIWANGLSLRPDSVLSPRDAKNAYNPATGLPLTQEERNKPGYALTDPRVKPDGDPCLQDKSVACADGTTNDGSFVSVSDNGIPRNTLEYYTYQGFKGILRVSWDIGMMMDSKLLTPNSFKLYGEGALLGFKDYPFYYEKKLERMPLMMGVNLPTFGLLDMLSFEVEYFNSPFRNTISSSFFERVPVPLDESGDPTQYKRELWRTKLLPDPGDPSYAAKAAAYDSLTRHLESEAAKRAWKWSIYSRKKIANGVSLVAQAASDHLRHFEIVYAKPSREPATTNPKEWYYVVRLEMGI